jgi:hypothetical protein
LWFSGHWEIQDNEDAEFLARVGLSNPFLTPEPAVSIHFVVAASRLRSG